MAPRAWPDTLPAPLVEGYATEPVDQVLRSEVKGGIQAFRRIGWERLDKAEVGWRMNDAQFALFRRWFSDGGWSIGGDSNNFSTWTTSNAAIDTSGVSDPPGTSSSAWRLLESTATSTHYADRSWSSTPANGAVVVSTISARVAGTARVLRWSIITKAGTTVAADVDLATGAIVQTVNSPVAFTTEPRGGGWYRLICTADIGTGATAPRSRAQLLSGTTTSYTGTTGAAHLSECSVRVRSSTGELYGATNSSGRLEGAAGGSAWVRMPLSFGGPVKILEARFSGAYSASRSAGSYWDVRAKLDVRYI